MLLINLHMVNKPTVAIIFAKHRFNFVVIFRKKYQQCSYKIYLQKCFTYGNSALVRCVEIPCAINIPVNYITNAKTILKPAYILNGQALHITFKQTLA